MKKTAQENLPKTPSEKKRPQTAARPARPQARRYFSARDSVKVVQARAGTNANPRVRFIVDSLVKHLHAFVKETGLTTD